MRAAVVTPWVGNGTEVDRYRPLLADEYQVTISRDVTGQHVAEIVPGPNEYTVEAVAADEVIAAIQADADYEVLWTEDV